MIPILIYGSIAVIALLTYLYARSTRRTYTCPECGEQVKTEHSNASCCPVCGHNLKENR